MFPRTPSRRWLVFRDGRLVGSKGWSDHLFDRNMSQESIIAGIQYWKMDATVQTESGLTVVRFQEDRPMRREYFRDHVLR